VTYRIVVRKAAARDAADAYDWYDEQRVGLGHEFLNEIEATLNRIGSGPLLFPVVLDDVRRALVQRFPYSVYFRVRGQEVRVLAVVRQSRDPRSWKRRV
jgi:plasmid stabilization system protein ParE